MHLSLSLCLSFSGLPLSISIDRVYQTNGSGISCFRFTERQTMDKVRAGLGKYTTPHHHHNCYYTTMDLRYLVWINLHDDGHPPAYIPPTTDTRMDAHGIIPLPSLPPHYFPSTTLVSASFFSRRWASRLMPLPSPPFHPPCTDLAFGAPPLAGALFLFLSSSSRG